MNFFERTSVKIRYLYLILVIIIFTVVSALTFLHTLHSIAALGELKKEVDTCFTDIHLLDHQLADFGAALTDSSQDVATIRQEIFTMCDDFAAAMALLKNEPLIRDTDTIPQHIDLVMAGITGIKKSVSDLPADAGPGNHGMVVSGLHNALIDPLLEAHATIRESLYQASFLQQKKYTLNLVFILFISITALILMVSLTEISNYRNIRQILDFSLDLERGDRKAKIRLTSGREFVEISRKLNSFLEKQSEKIRFLRTIGEGKDHSSFEPESADILGNEIMVMAGRLRRSQEEETNRQAEDSRRNWTSEGIAQFYELLRSERENVRELAHLVIQKLVTYLHIEMGTLFLAMEDEQKERWLETIAAYAYDRRKYINATFRFGEGLPGTCALEKEKIYMNDIPETFSNIISGTGQTRPRHALLVPLRIREEIFGVLELASFRALEKHELDFVDQIADSIASGLEAVRNNERTALLLQQSRDQEKQLRQQEEELRINLQMLESAREESLEKESEISGILYAVNESSMVAEYSTTGRFTQINDKFLEFLEAQGDMVLGKHHSEFAVIDRHTDEYKKFWEALKSGEIINRDEMFRLFSGKEVWLRQTYTPVLNEEGKVSRILNIASDITTMKKQQELLNRQDAETTALQRELESIRSELDRLKKQF
ncbi:MAG: GAF domain-containing protein [Bacteroidales bacterium]|nr:GAF domain-containing protein [Bacteroidales bacterium]MDT8432401.1 GAF domain-containing protein [Bacteroidales bacterium]